MSGKTTEMTNPVMTGRTESIVTANNVQMTGTRWSVVYFLTILVVFVRWQEASSVILIVLYEGGLIQQIKANDEQQTQIWIIADS